jgi:hypothetical protein
VGIVPRRAGELAVLVEGATMSQGVTDVNEGGRGRQCGDGVCYRRTGSGTRGAGAGPVWRPVGRKLFSWTSVAIG